MSQRKTYLIDKRFQLRHTLSILGFLFIIIIIIIGAITINIIYNHKKLNKITDALSNIIVIQDNIVNAVMTYSQETKKQVMKTTPDDSKKTAVMKEKPKTIDKNKDMIDYKKTLLELMRNHDTNKATMLGNIRTINGIIRQNNLLILLIIIFVIMQGFLLFFILIRKTHKISGPIYVLSRYFESIIEGKAPAIRPLRKDDELREFYDLFIRVVDVLKQKGVFKEEI